MFFKGSRYEKVPSATFVDPAGRQIQYKLVRWIPDTKPVAGHLVGAEDRLDLIAWQAFRDAERFWRICDANRALWPADLLEEGAVIGIPASEG